MTIFWIVAPRGLIQCSSIRLEPRTPSPKLSHEFWLNRIAYRVTKTLIESTVISLFQCESKQKCDKNVKLATMQHKKSTIYWTQEPITHNMRIAVEKHWYCWRLPTFRRTYRLHLQGEVASCHSEKTVTAYNTTHRQKYITISIFMALIT